MVYTDHKTVFRRRTVRKGRRNVKTGVRLIWHHEGGVGGPDCPRWGEVITVGHQPAPRTGHWPRLTDHAPAGGRGWGWHWTRPTYDAPTGGRGTMGDPPHDRLTAVAHRDPVDGDLGGVTDLQGSTLDLHWRFRASCSLSLQPVWTGTSGFTPFCPGRRNGYGS